MLSYWEQQSFLHYDHVVIGSGIVGLSVAIELKDKYPRSRVLVLERGLLPTGASSRNAGFACMGSLTELLDDKEYMTEDEIMQLFELRKMGLEKLRKRLGDDRIGYAARGSYELISTEEEHALEKLEEVNNLLYPILNRNTFSVANDKIDEFGFSPAYTKALVENTCEGELHTGKMLRALIDFAISKGIEIKTGADVSRFEEEQNYVALFISDPFRKAELVLHAGTLTICTNAFTKQLLPHADVIPGRGQVLITQPIKGLKFKGIFHFDKGYYYFREIDGRILLGGGRNMDFEKERTTDFALNEAIQIALEEKLRDIIIPNTHYHIEQRWTGIMAFGATKQPIVKAFSERVYGAFRMGGMGVAIGSEVASKLIKLFP
jgi:gamma-glutamylputrescine oxidase